MLKICTIAICIGMILGLAQNGFARTTPLPLADKTHYVELSAKQFLQNSSSSAFMKSNNAASTSMQQSFMISADKMQAIFAQQGVVTLHDFPIAPQQTGTLELVTARSPINAHTQIWVNTKNGDQLYTPPPMQCYKGFISDEPGSKVFFGVVNGDMIGSITRADGSQYTFSPVAKSTEDQREHVLIANEEVDKLENGHVFQCSADQTENYFSEKKDFSKKVIHEDVMGSGDLLQFDLAVETNSDVYKRIKDIDKIIAYFNVVYAMVSSIYEDEVNVTFNINYAYIWTDDIQGNGVDPYPKSGDIGAVLPNFGEYWTNNRSDITRDAAQLVTGQGVTSVGGIAYRSTLCQTDKFGAYSVVGTQGTNPAVYPTLNYTWDVMVIAHELGHNFAARHTHDCWWNPPLDTCVNKDGNPPIEDACFTRSQHAAHTNPGTIMSYCHLINPGAVTQLTFTPKVATVIRGGAEGAPCLTPPDHAVVLLQRPLGKQVLQGNGTTEIRWTSWQVNNVRLQYSTDAGESWINISDNPIPATNRTYQWTVPAIATTKALVRVMSATDPMVADTSMAVFEIKALSLSITTPVEGSLIGQGETVSIKWTASLVSSVNILFSRDNGQNWETLQSNYTSPSYSWKVPYGVATKQGIIRIEASNDNTIVTQSGSLDIGAQTITITSPKGGDQLDKSSYAFPIHWSSNYAKKVRIEYSADNGKNWTRLTPITGDTLSPVNGEHEFGWQTPSQPTTQGVIRITSLTDLSIIVSTATFTILNQVSVSEYFQELSSEGVSVVPNPINQTAEIHYQTKAFVKQLHIIVRDLTGKVVADLGTLKDIAVGDHVLNMDSSSLANGVYFLSLDAGRTPVVKQITVIR